MPTYNILDELDCGVTAGADITLNINAQDCEGTARNWTGATSLTDAVTFTPTVGASWTADIVLDGDPTAVPQATVAIADTDTSSLTAPQRIFAWYDVTLASGSHDVGGFWFKLHRKTIATS